MTPSRKIAAAITSALVLSLVGTAGAAGAADAAPAARKPAWSKNCTALNQKWAHGVGRARAKDSTSGKPVTTFLRSDKLYSEAMSYNRGLDRDKDGIACEKR
ncbi:excalibur calcium-binding domain-containing protein [Nocardioides sp.]|uniref:excalibur calcium-binding domain-containing protein n=1 Tax=Nocardioides sp. TaxID=35761 RepID=UPI003514C87E